MHAGAYRRTANTCRKKAKSRNILPDRKFYQTVGAGLRARPQSLILADFGRIRLFSTPKLKPRFVVRRRAPGNPRRGFPTPKQSTGLFRLPSCAFARKRISLRARSDQRFHLWIPPPLKRRAKFYFRADGFQRHSAFFARPKILSNRRGEVPPSPVRIQRS